MLSASEILAYLFRNKFLREDCEQFLASELVSRRAEEFWLSVLTDEVSEELMMAITNIQEVKARNPALFAIAEIKGKIKGSRAWASYNDYMSSIDAKPGTRPIMLEAAACQLNKSMDLSTIFSRNFPQPFTARNVKSIDEFVYYYAFDREILYQEDEHGDFLLKKDDEIHGVDRENLAYQNIKNGVAIFCSADEKKILYIKN